MFADEGEDAGGAVFSVPSNAAPYNRVIIPCEQIVTKSTIGEGEFGVVKSGVWTNEQGHKVRFTTEHRSKFNDSKAFET